MMKLVDLIITKKIIENSNNKIKKKLIKKEFKNLYIKYILNYASKFNFNKIIIFYDEGEDYVFKSIIILKLT